MEAAASALRSVREIIKVLEPSHSTDYTSAAMKAASGSGKHEDTRWSFEGEIKKVLELSLELSFPDFEHELKWFENEEDDPGDYTCQSVLTIWPQLRKHPELRRQKYPKIILPKHVGDVIRNNLQKCAGEMIQESSVRDLGVVVFSLSRKWLAESIHKMLIDGIDTWAPKLPVERVIVHFPSLDKEIHLGWFRQQAIAHTLMYMLEYSKVYAVIHQYNSFPELRSLSISQLRRKWGKSILIKERHRDALIYVENKPPFILARGDFPDFERDLGKLWPGSIQSLADWIIYVTPVHQQEYIEMCYTAAKLEGLIRTDIKGKWNPSHENQCPLLTYAGYRAYSSTKQEFSSLLDQLKPLCIEVARGEDARLLRYTADAVLDCVLIYTCLKNHRLADCTFNSDEMVKEEGNTFVYLLHRLADVRRITNNSSEGINELKKASKLLLEKYEGCEEGGERMLELHLLQFTEVLEVSSLYVSPHVLCEYLYDLSKKFKSYNDFVDRTGPATETRLLLCEATAVVMEKCFHLLGITPEVRIDLRNCTLKLFRNLTMDVGVEPIKEKQKMAERERMDNTILEPEFVDRFITPCFVSDARDPSRNSRFQVFSICPCMTEGSKFEKGHLFGRILVSDKYGLRSDVGYPYYEPDFPYVTYFDHEYRDPVNICDHQLLYLENPSSHHSVPFSSSIGVRMDLYATTENKDDCFQLCDINLDIDLEDIWAKESNSYCGCVSVEGEDGRILLYYILLKDAIDASLELSFKADETGAEVHGHIFAYYGDELYHDCPPMRKPCYQTLLFRSGLIPLNNKRYEIIPLNRSALSVPKNAPLIIDAYFLDAKTQDVILFDSYKFFSPTKEGSSEGYLFGTDFSMKLKVDWKF